MAKAKSLGRVELQVLQYIDQHQPVTGRQVVDYWAEKHASARTTVMTIIDRLQDKGYLSRKKQNGVYHYVTRRSAASVLQGLVGDFVAGVLGGSLSPFAAYLSGAKGLNPRELAELKRIVEQLQPSPDCADTTGTESTPSSAQVASLPDAADVLTSPPSINVQADDPQAANPVGPRRPAPVPPPVISQNAAPASRKPKGTTP